MLSKTRSLAIVFLLTATPCSAFAVSVPYYFTTTGISLETRNFVAATPEQRLYSDLDVIAGQFTYENQAVELSGTPPGTSVYLAMSDLQGSVDGQSFSDPQGVAVIQDNAPFPAGCGDPPAQPCQGVQDRAILVADSANVMNFSGFMRDDGTMTGFELVNFSLFWIGDASTIDDTVLPMMLPPDGFATVGLRLDFVQIGAPDVVHSVFGLGTAVAAVPLPAAFWLLAGAVGLLGASARRGRG